MRRSENYAQLTNALCIDEQKRSASFKDFTKAPFCFVILNSDRQEDDELAEAMLFNLINSKALPIASEHSLSVLMRDDGAATERFVEDPQVYLTRWICEKVKNWPHGFYTAIGDNPLSRLHCTAGVLTSPRRDLKIDSAGHGDRCRATFRPTL